MFLYLLAAFLAVRIDSFVPTPTIRCHSLELCLKREPTTDVSRRSLLVWGPSVALATLLVADTKPAVAADVLFRKNPLTNPLLEQIRIWEQAEADELKYGGELEAGDAGNRGKTEAYPSLLVPILRINDDLSEVSRLIEDPLNYEAALTILKRPYFEKIAFKKIFNRYGDNIYYSDPDRANLYLGGGATPKSEQSMAYLLRNDVLTNCEDLRAELEYVVRENSSETDDLFAFARSATSAMKKYLELVPPREMEAARKLQTLQDKK